MQVLIWLWEKEQLLPVLINFGLFKIYATGTLWGLAVLVSGIAASRAAYRKGFHPLWTWDLVAFAFIGGLILGRLGYFITKPGSLEEGPMEILRVWHGGMSLHWGVLGGFTVAFFHSWRHGLSFRHFSDTLAPALALGLAVSRFGCFLNGCCYGLPCPEGYPLAVTFPTEPMYPGLPASHPTDGLPRYPTQLFHFAANFAVYLILMRLQLRPVVPGGVFAGFFIFYSAGRFVVEFYRDDMVHAFWGLTVAQVASIALIAVGLVMWWAFAKWASREEGGINRKNFDRDCKDPIVSDA
jgi:phosphatidylglycerol:prolipoprotein diacylglycerol transferase